MIKVKFYLKIFVYFIVACLLPFYTESVKVMLFKKKIPDVVPANEESYNYLVSLLDDKQNSHLQDLMYIRKHAHKTLYAWREKVHADKDDVYYFLRDSGFLKS